MLSPELVSISNHRVYDAFGVLESQTNAAVDCLFGYTGRPFDKATGEQYNSERWYEAVTGRWLNEDPMGFAAGDANLNRYVGNSPLNLIDPSGLGFVYPGSDNRISGGNSDGYGIMVGYDAEDIDGDGPAEGDPCYAVRGEGSGDIDVWGIHDLRKRMAQWKKEHPDWKPTPAWDGPSIGPDTFTEAERSRERLLLRAQDPNLSTDERAAALDRYLDMNFDANASPMERGLYRGFGPGQGFDQAMNAMAGFTPGGSPGIPRGGMPELTAPGEPSVNASSAGKPTRPGSATSQAGSSLQSHAGRPGWPGPKPSGNAAAVNAQGQSLVNDILRNRDSTFTTRSHPRPEWGGSVTDVYRPDGLGARFDANGNFIGFITRQ